MLPIVMHWAVLKHSLKYLVLEIIIGSLATDLIMYICFEQKIEFSHPNNEQMLNLDEASSQEEPIDPYEQQDDILYELHDQSSDQFLYKCSECHVDIESGYHCRECNVSTLVCALMLLYSGKLIFVELPSTLRS